MPTLADIYSTIDSAKRRVGDFLSNPGTSLQNMVNDANARAGTFNKQANVAAQEFQKTGKMTGPEQMALAQQFAAGYNPAGMTVWHGSPYKFQKFDASKIGTGEGAQAYGHGLYVAENPEVAKGYQKILSKDVFSVDGQPFDPSKLQHLNVRVPASKGDLTTAINKAKEISYSNSPSANLAAQDLAVLNDVKAKGGFKPHEGNLYQIDLPDEHIEKMLDWDKPLSEQPHIMEALTPENMGLTLRQPENNGFMAYVASNGKPVGMQQKGVTPEKFRQRWLERLAEFGDAEGGAGRAIGYLGGTSTSGDLAPAVVDAIRQTGIPGIKYLDEGSRRTGSGTRNMVIFPGNEHLLQIQDINGNPIQ